MNWTTILSSRHVMFYSYISAYNARTKLLTDSLHSYMQLLSFNLSNLIIIFRCFIICPWNFSFYVVLLDFFVRQQTNISLNPHTVSLSVEMRAAELGWPPLNCQFSFICCHGIFIDCTPYCHTHLFLHSVRQLHATALCIFACISPAQPASLPSSARLHHPSHVARHTHTTVTS